MPDIQWIIQGGAVGLAALLIWVNFKGNDRFSTLMTNHFVHFAEILSAIKTQGEATNDKLDTLCSILREKNEK